MKKQVGSIGLPTVTLRPTGETTRPADSKWIGQPQVHSDDDGNSYLIVPCCHMEVSIGFGEDPDDLELIVKRLQERLDEMRAMRA